MPISQLKDDWFITKRWLFSIAMPFCHIFFVDLSINNNYSVNWMEELHLMKAKVRITCRTLIVKFVKFLKSNRLRQIYTSLYSTMDMSSVYLLACHGFNCKKDFWFYFMNCNNVLRIDISSKSIRIWHFKVNHMLKFMISKEYISFGLYANLYPKV